MFACAKLTLDASLKSFFLPIAAGWGTSENKKSWPSEKTTVKLTTNLYLTLMSNYIVSWDVMELELVQVRQQNKIKCKGFYAGCDLPGGGIFLPSGLHVPAPADYFLSSVGTEFLPQ